MEEKRKYKPNTIFSPNKIIALIGFLISIFLLGPILQLIFTYIYSNNLNITYNELLQLFKDLNNASTDVQIAYQNVIVFSNFISYLFAAFFTITFLRDELIIDFNKFKDNRKTIIYLIIFPIIFAGLSYLISFIFENISGSSQNQTSIVNAIKSPYGFLMIISVVLFAPFAEELIYRKLIFHYTRGFHIVIRYIASIFLFSIVHMLSFDVDFVTWLLRLIPYMLSAFLLCFIYHKSNYNIYVSIAAHLLNNLVAVIILFI